MDESARKSEVARTVRQIDVEQEAADRALHSFAITARHDFINARMQRNGERILNLIEQGKHEEAQSLLNTDDWGEKRQQMTKHPRCIQTQKKGQKRGK